MAKTTFSKDEKNLIEFGKRVKQVREKLGLTVYDLTGDDMPIKTRQHWQLIESGKKNINMTTMFKVAKSLGVSATNLLKGID